jgi:KDO2-lipid IV(A) lauroyltransferase
MMPKSLRRFATFLLIRFLLFLAFLLPRNAGRAFFRCLGRLAYRLLRRSREVAIANLQLVYDGRYTEGELEAIARDAFSNLSIFAYDAVRMGKYTPKTLKDMVEAVGLEKLDRLLSKGQGVVGLTGHVGNWELLGGYLALKGYPVNVLATEVKNKRLDHLLVGIRESTGMKVLERSRSLMGAFRCLKQGEILGVLMDQDTSVESVVVDFLGHPAKTPVGPVKLASGSGGAIVPMVMLMTPDGKYRIEIKEPLAIGGNGDTLKRDVEKCSKAIEEFIRSEPTQWVWMHKRWKSVSSEMYQ